MCTSPRARLETFERYTNKQGGISYRAKIASWEDVEHNMRFYKAKYRKVDMIPCGQCMQCRIKRAEDKKNQCILEMDKWNKDSIWFVTLTYDDVHLKTHKVVNTETGELYEGISLNKKDCQDFIKRLREYLRYNKKIEHISYLLAGEYGSKTARPHAHAIIYGLILDENQLQSQGNSAGSGMPIWRSLELEKIWKNGNVIVGKAEKSSMGYVSKYILKKQLGGQAKEFYATRGIIPEFTLQSKKPTLGYDYVIENLNHIKEFDKIYGSDKNGVTEILPPQSAMRILKRTDQEKYNEIKLRRKCIAEKALKTQDYQTNLDRQSRRDARARTFEKKFKDLRGL